MKQVIHCGGLALFGVVAIALIGALDAAFFGVVQALVATSGRTPWGGAGAAEVVGCKG